MIFIPFFAMPLAFDSKSKGALCVIPSFILLITCRSCINLFHLAISETYRLQVSAISLCEACLAFVGKFNRTKWTALTLKVCVYAS
ncbi:MAG: hypothetical protein ACTS6G_00545 [Candidatus Hodgkinia cicadicola]